MSGDDEITVSTSSREFLESPAKAKREALKNKLKREGVRPKTNDLQGLKLQVLKQKMDGRKDAGQKRDEKSRNAPPRPFGTMTREQEIRSQQRTADEKPSADQLVEQGQADAKAAEEIQKQEVATEEG